MKVIAVILVRGRVPDRKEAKKLVELRMADAEARCVCVPRGLENYEAETCTVAYSRHADLLPLYGSKGTLFDKIKGGEKPEPEGVPVHVTRIGGSVEEGPSGIEAPSGYKVEKRGPYYRLLHLDTGKQFPEKMLHKKDFLKFIESFEGE